MKERMINQTHVEGLLYQHNLAEKTTGENSAHPGTQYISGTIDIATDNAMTNIVQIHFTYTTPTTATGKANAAYGVLKDIIAGRLGTVMGGAANPAKLRIDSAIALNEFYSNRNGEETLVSVPRNEGGFIHIVTDSLADKENQRATFDCDMLITKAKRVEADEERNRPEYVEVSGAVFDFRKRLLPITFKVMNDSGMDYFEGLEASDSNPVFTRVRGEQVSQIVKVSKSEEGAFGDAYVREYTNTRRDWIITWAAGEPYVFDDDNSLTAAELKEMIGQRETDLAAMKQRQAEYRASQNNAPGAFNSAPAASNVPAKGDFKF